MKQKGDAMIFVIDFGSQTAHLITRRLRDMGVATQLIEPDQVLSRVMEQRPAGIIFSGGPASVYEPGAPTVDSQVFELGIPILGICYGWQLTARLLHGKVVQGRREYGPTVARKKQASQLSPLLKNVTSDEITVWMSHGDEVVELPAGFEYLISTDNIKAAGVADEKKQIYGVQFHPEVEHTQEGLHILQNFVSEVCGLTVSLRQVDVQQVIAEVRELANAKGSTSRAVAAVSGGVDSTVAAAIVAAAIGDRFVPIYCENGLMRAGTEAAVRTIFEQQLKSKPVIVACQDRFLESLKGLTDPEKKRKAIGKLYIQIFEEEAKKLGQIDFLVQGTIFSDVIESQGSKHASKIKSHHNVGGLPEDMQLDLLEPLRQFYKDEVKELGRQLGLPEETLQRQPFPGPGQAIRILGEVTPDRLAKQQQADQIVLEVLQQTGWFEKVFQSFPVMTGMKSTAVKGDGRVYGEVVGLRVYDSSDIMTAGWTRLPYEVLQQISTRIVNEVPDVSRVVYDVTTKPPATMEWE